MMRIQRQIRTCRTRRGCPPRREAVNRGMEQKKLTFIDIDSLKPLIARQADSPFLRFLFERMPAPVAIVDTEMRYLAASRRWYEDYGLTGTDIIGRSHYEVFPDIPQRWKEAHRRCLAGEGLASREDQFLRADGSSIWLSWELVPVTGDADEVLGMMMLTEVITREVTAETARAESERSLMLAERAAHIGTWHWNLETDLVECSPEMCRLIGIDPASRIMKIDDLVQWSHPQDRATVAARVAGVRAGGEPHPMLETRVARPDGAVAWMRLAIWADRDEQGRTIRVNGVIQDVTEHRRVEREAAFRSEAIETAASPLAITGMDGLYIYVNRALVELFGVGSADDLIGRGAVDFAVDPSQIWGSITALRDKGRWTGELRLRRANDGRVVDVSVYAAVVRDDDGMPYRIVASYSDVTERNRVVQELSRRESLLMQAQELARLGPWRFDVASRTYHLPPETRLVMGLGDGFATYGPTQAASWIHPADLPEVRRVTRRMLRGEIDRAEVQYRYSGSGRGTLHVRVIMGTERGPDGAVIGLSGLIQDVTSVMELERAHRETERAMAALMSNLSGMVYRCMNDERWTMHFVSSACRQLLGYEPDEIVDNRVVSYSDVIDPRDRARVWEVIQDAVVKRRAFQLSYRVIRRDGDLRWVFEQGSAIRDENDEVVALEGYVADITDEQRIVERLQESEERNRAIMAAASVAIVTADEYGNIESFNPEAESIFGYRAEEVVGRNLRLLMPEPHRSAHDEFLSRYRRGEGGGFLGTGPRELMGERKSGEVFPLDVAISAVNVGDRRIFIGSLRDLAERKKAEARLSQAQKMETVGQLVGGVSHDFNNLLMAMQLNLELANMLAADRPDVSESITVALNAVERGAELTRRLLAFSRQQPLVPKVVDANDVVNSMMRLLHRLLREDIDTRTVLDPDVYPVELDPAQLETALVNLVVNARDAMPEGGSLIIETGNVHADAAVASEFEDMVPGDYVMLAISDTGSGMEPEVLERAFDPFFTTKEVGKGSGLGLSMVYGYVRQSGGHVKIYSEAGQGTTVKLLFPRSFRRVELAATPAPAPTVRSGSETVLLVEDDADVRFTVERLLKSLGYTVVAASDGPAAVALIDEGFAPDLLLADVVLPKGMSGRDVSEAVAARVPDCCILFMSGYTEDAVMHQGRLDEGVVLLSKPFPRELLARKVRELLDVRAGKK
ncbi:MAG: PAS domain S-box protein [Alphaproteobacteria bacterium]|nr:PAS domain S-box protein [Alphaproteobacteria bacterium]